MRQLAQGLAIDCRQQSRRAVHVTDHREQLDAGLGRGRLRQLGAQAEGVIDGRHGVFPRQAQPAQRQVCLDEGQAVHDAQVVQRQRRLQVPAALRRGQHQRGLGQRRVGTHQVVEDATQHQAEAAALCVFGGRLKLAHRAHRVAQVDQEGAAAVDAASDAVGVSKLRAQRCDLFAQCQRSLQVAGQVFIHGHRIQQVGAVQALQRRHGQGFAGGGIRRLDLPDAAQRHGARRHQLGLLAVVQQRWALVQHGQALCVVVVAAQVSGHGNPGLCAFVV